MIDITDRVPTKPNRRKITYEDGRVEYVTIEYADEPSNQGTPINKALFENFYDDIIDNNTQLKIKIYTENSTFIVPRDGYYKIIVTGAGGTASNTLVLRQQLASGGTGIKILKLKKDQEISIVIGINNGESSSFGNYVVAEGANLRTPGNVIGADFNYPGQAPVEINNSSAGATYDSYYSIAGASYWSRGIVRGTPREFGSGGFSSTPDNNIEGGQGVVVVEWIGGDESE